MKLPPSHLTVLEAMLKSDPRPPSVLDSPAEAIHRRVPNVDPLEAAEILCTLNALGLTRVPYITGMVSAATTAKLATWITPEGWKALGMEANLNKDWTN